MSATTTPGPWRYEAATKTIRAVPSNYWLATMDSWDGAVNNEANAQLIASAPLLLSQRDALLEALKRLLPVTPACSCHDEDEPTTTITGYTCPDCNARLAISKAKEGI